MSNKSFGDVEDKNSDKYREFIVYYKSGDPTSEKFLYFLRNFPIIKRQCWATDLNKIGPVPYIQVVPTIVRQVTRKSSGPSRGGGRGMDRFAAQNMNTGDEYAKKYEGIEAYRLINYLGSQLQGNKSSLTYEGRHLSFGGKSSLGGKSGGGSAKRTGGFGYAVIEGVSDMNGVDLTSFNAQRVDNDFEDTGGQFNQVRRPLPSISEIKAKQLPAFSNQTSPNMNMNMQQQQQQQMIGFVNPMNPDGSRRKDSEIQMEQRLKATMAERDLADKMRAQTNAMYATNQNVARSITQQYSAASPMGLGVQNTAEAQQVQQYMQYQQQLAMQRQQQQQQQQQQPHVQFSGRR